MNLMPVYDKIIVGSVKVEKEKRRCIDPFRNMKQYFTDVWRFLISCKDGRQFVSLDFHDKRWCDYWKQKIRKGNLLFVCYDRESNLLNNRTRIQIFHSQRDYHKHFQDTMEWCRKEVSQLSERQKTIQERLADYEKQV